MQLTFLEVSQFTLTAKGVLSDNELFAVEDELLENPEAGERITGTGGVRKIRAAIAGRGKRGGARILYYYVPSRAVVYFIVVYAKKQSSTLTADGKKVMRKWTAMFDRE
ncbi:MAG TPA: type II toxin-antitoxin system RelE/ParE family toxin [Gemmatimonadaceae bacterium]